MNNIITLLGKIQFPKCYSRKNISSSYSESFCLGDVNYRGQSYIGGKTRGPSKYNKKYPELFVALQKLIAGEHPEFNYTTIQINKNVLCIPHIDKNNVGDSMIIGLGDYTGGELVVEGQPTDIHNKFVVFDGRKGHWNEDWDGCRYSMIFFTHTFKPPNPKTHGIKVTKDGIWDKNGNVIKSYDLPDRNF
jgi:hypothetical protein